VRVSPSIQFATRTRPDHITAPGRLARRTARLYAQAVEIQIRLGGATRVLALQIESCSPWLIASRVDAR
jgi:hypothetical protein